MAQQAAAVPGQDKTIVMPGPMTSGGRLALPSDGRAIVLYHKGCKDGWASAWVASKALGPATDYYGVAYGDPHPDVDYTGCDVYIIDFSYDRETLEAIHKVARQLVVLDHHKTAQEALKGLDYAFFDMERSGAGMAWDYFFGPAARHWLVDYVEDRDLWRFKLRRSKEVNAYIQSLEYTFDAWNKASMRDWVWAAEAGEHVMSHVKQYIQQIVGANLQRRYFFGQPHVPLINAAHTDVSELLDELISATGEPFAVAWRMRSNGSISFSLRSRSDFDVSEWAKIYGGGGHKNAAGFELDGKAAVMFLNWLVLGVPMDVTALIKQDRTRV